MNTIGPADIREANALACLQALRFAGSALTLTGLAQRTGLSRPTVDAVLSAFIADGLVSEVDTEPTGSLGGRPARRFTFVPSAGLVAGVDAGPLRGLVILADLAGNVLARTEGMLPKETGEERFAAVVALIDDALARAGQTAASLRAIGVAVSGIVAADGTIELSTIVPDWKGRNIAAELGERFDCVAFAENDVKVAAFAEHHFGAAQDVDSIVYLHVSDWITVALTLDAQIFHGAHRGAGEVGSRRGMRWASNARRAVPSWTRAADGDELVRLALAGDEAALAEIDAFFDELMPTFATVVLTLDPDRVVVSGYFAEPSGAIVARFRDRLTAMVALDVVADVVPSSLNGNATALGALATAYQNGSSALFGIGSVPVPAEILTPATTTPEQS